MTRAIQPPAEPEGYAHEENEAAINLMDALSWLGDGKRLIAATTLGATLLALLIALLLTPYYTARVTLMPPGSQQSGGAAAALASLGAVGGLAGSLGGKSAEELYVAIIKSDSVVRGLAAKFALKERYDVETHETLRVTVPKYIRASSDKKSGLITIEVDDKDPKFAADLANAHVAEVTKVLGRLTVTEAQQRRVFFENQLGTTKENLVKAEAELRRVQEKSGVVVLDRQAEALLSSVARARALIAEREVQLKVLRTAATDQNPDVRRLLSEIMALRDELARMESTGGAAGGSATDLPVGKIPAAAVDFLRAVRELKLQESLLEIMVRQYELAKLDEAREGPQLQIVDSAQPPDYKSKPSRALIVVAAALLSLLVSTGWVLFRAALASRHDRHPEDKQAWQRVRNSWQLRGPSPPR